jgi:transposase-like protein
MSRSGSAREKWTRIIREQRASGLSVAAFCAERGIPASSLFAWRRRLAGAGDATPSGSAFVEAKVRGAQDSRDGGVTIELACGRRVTVTRGFDRQLLLEVLDALESGARDGVGSGAAS